MGKENQDLCPEGVPASGPLAREHRFFPKLFLSLSTHNFGFQAVIEIETGYVGKGIKAIQEMYC